MDPTVGAGGQMVAERRVAPRYHLLTRVDVLMAGNSNVYWGGVNNLSRTGVAITLRQPLKTNQEVTIRFRFQSADGREATEELTAKVIWRNGDNTGLKFDLPLTAGSPALQKAPHLAAHLTEKESGR
jgi:hypothetical protein